MPLTTTSDERSPETTDQQEPTRERLADFELNCRSALTQIRELVIAQKVTVRETDTIGWGQWLDEPHHMDDQWGRFGSSAGVQVLAMTQRLLGGDTPWTESANCRALSPQLFPDVVPEIPAPSSVPGDHRESSPEDHDPWKHRDFAQPLKVAFCVDALSADCQTEVQGAPPALVRHLIELRLDEPACWTTRSLDDPKHQFEDQFLVTAFALHALRRFPAVHQEPRVAQAYRWLAQQSRRRDKNWGVDVLALCGLALCGATGHIRRESTIESTLKFFDGHMSDWAGANPTPIIERPWINAYVEGRHADYVFLSPETVVALYFLARQLPSPEKVYVSIVAQAIVDNIVSGNGGGRRGLRVQAGLEGTVDQLWATRLLLAIVERIDAQELIPLPETPAVLPVPREPAAPPVLRRAGTEWRRPVQLGVAGVVAIGAGTVATALSAPLLVAVAATIGAAVGGKVLGAAVDPAIDKLMHKDGHHADDDR
jgi:hypothetical protein